MGGDSPQENELKWMMLDTIIDMTDEEWRQELENEFDSSTSEDETEPDQLIKRKYDI